MLDGPDCQGAFQAFALQLALHVIRLGNVAVEGMGVGLAAAAAKEARPAIGAFFLAENVILREAALHGGIKAAVEHGAHAHAGASHKLVAGIDVPIGGDGHVFVARAATSQALA